MKKIFLRLKSIYDYDDIQYEGIRFNKFDLFNLSIDEDYYKPIKTNDAFNNFISSKDSNEIRAMCTKSNNIE